LGIEACGQTYGALYIRIPDLMRNFENYRDDIRALTSYRKQSVIITSSFWMSGLITRFQKGMLGFFMCYLKKGVERT